MTYYNDDEKLTYEGAEKLVLEYINTHEQYKTITDCKEVARWADAAMSRHNLTRLDDALSRMCEEHRNPTGRPRRYRI